MQANPLKFVDDLKNKGIGFGWNVRLPAAPNNVLNRQFLTRDHGTHEEALRCALAWRDEMCKSLPFPIHARVTQYLDGTHKAIQPYQLKGKPLKVRAQWVEFDPEIGSDRTRNLYRIVAKPELYDAVYREVEALVRPRIVREAERVAAQAALRAASPREVRAPIPPVLEQTVERCRTLFPDFEGGSLEDLQTVLAMALDELTSHRRRAAFARLVWPR